MKSLTRKQAELLSYIKDYIAQNGGVAPCYEEMREAMDVASKSGVHRLLTALERRGHITRVPGQARCIELCEEGGLSAYPTIALIAELARRKEMNGRAA